MSLTEEQEILAGLEEELGCLSSGAPSPLSGPSLSSSQPLNHVHQNNNGSNCDIGDSLLLPPSCIQERPGKRGGGGGEGEGAGEADEALQQAAALLLEESGPNDQMLSFPSSASGIALAGLGEDRRLGEGGEEEEGEREEGGSLCGDSHSPASGSGGNGIGKGTTLMTSKSTIPAPPRPPPQPSARKITMSLRPPRQRRAFDGYETSMNGGGGEGEDEDEENDEDKDGSGRRSGRRGSSSGRWGGSSAASRGGRSGGGGSRSGGVTRSNSNNSNSSSSSSSSSSSANGLGPSSTPFNSAVCKKRLYGPGRGRWKRRRFEGNGSMDDITSEVLRLLQTRGPLSFDDIHTALPRQLRVFPHASPSIQSVLDVLRATPLVNLVREEKDSPLLYTFLDGQKVPKPIEMGGLKEESAALESTEDELRRRISLLRGELAALKEGGKEGGRTALEVLTRVMGQGPAGGGEGGRESAKERMAANPIFRAALLALGVQV